LKENSIVKSSTVSLVLRIILWSSIVALVILSLYIYHQGTWREILRYYRYFFDPKRLRIFIESFGHFAGFAFVLIQALQVVFAPVPGEITGFVGGFLFGKIWGVLLSTIGLTLGSIGAFAITRVFGLRFVEKVVKTEYIEKFNYFVTHKGLYLTFIFFIIPGFPKDSLCYLLGLTRMRRTDFVLMNVFGRLPGTLILTLQGDALRNGQFQAFFALLLLSALLMVVLYFAKAYIMRFFAYVVHLIFGKKKDKNRYGDPIISKDLK
jgi:uncharacterized membrane protein YdjX (TVP38/TMEM64 family)